MSLKAIFKTVQNAADELDQTNIIIKNWDAIQSDDRRRQAIFHLKVIASDILTASIDLEKELGN